MDRISRLPRVERPKQILDLEQGKIESIELNGREDQSDLLPWVCARLITMSYLSPPPVGQEWDPKAHKFDEFFIQTFQRFQKIHRTIPQDGKTIDGTALYWLLDQWRRENGIIDPLGHPMPESVKAAWRRPFVGSTANRTA